MIRAAVKGILTRHLTYDDIYALVKSTATDPRPWGSLTESISASWETVFAADAGSWNEHWRTYRLLPLLRVISEQPSHRLQSHTLRGMLLDEAATSNWVSMVLKLPRGEAAEVLSEYPDLSTSESSIDWKLNHLSLEIAFTALNTAVLFKLGSRGFGISQAKIEPWLDLYAEAYSQLFAQAALLGAEYEKPPGIAIRDARDDKVLLTTETVLSAMREEIASDRADVDECARRYEQLVEVTRTLLRAAG